MSRKPVDLGPMMLQVGDDAVDLSKGLVARESDVQRLKQLLTGGGQRQTGNSIHDADNNAESLALPSGLSGTETDTLVQLAETLPVMVPPQDSSAAKSVQLQLHGELLPNTTLTAFESAGRVHFEIHINNLSGRSWLSSKLPWLVRQVGEKLRRPIRVTVLASGVNEFPSVTVDWPEGIAT